MVESKPPLVSLVIPVYNEIECLEGLLAEIRDAMDPCSYEYEVVLVDDGSSDGSSEYLDRAAADDPHLVPLHFVHNAGQTAAFAAGFEAARGELVATLDADGQNPPHEIPRLVDAMDEGVDIVAGYRAKRQDSAWRLFQSRIANSVRNKLSGETIRDTGCSLKVFRAHFVKSIPLFTGMHRFLPTLCRMAGARTVIEVPVDHRERQGGVSKYGMLNRAFRAFVDLLAVRWMQKRWLVYEVGGASASPGEPSALAADPAEASRRAL